MHLKNTVLGEQNEDGSWPIESATITGSGWRAGYVREDLPHTFTVTAQQYRPDGAVGRTRMMKGSEAASAYLAGWSV